MSAEVETMFSGNRVVPWHGLGEVVEGTLCSAEAIEKAGLNWEVRSEPIFTETKIEIPHYRANIRATDNKVLGVVSDRYKIVQNTDAFTFTDNLIGENCQYETAGSLHNGKRIFLLAKLPEKKIVEDNFDNYICFTNSHDGTGAIKVCMTPIRVVCQNTLNLALEKATRCWSTRHIGDLNSKMEEAKRTLQMANDYMDELAKTADKLAHTKVTEAEASQIISELFPIEDSMSDRQKNNINENRNNFMVCMLSPDILKFQGTAWQIINAASDFATHTAPKRLTETYQENNFSKVLDGNIIIDKTFEKLMAKVK